MEESQESQGQAPMSQPSNPQSPEVGFPLPSSQPTASKAGNKLPLIILGVVILLAAGGIFFLTRGSRETANPTPSPETEGVTTETPVPTSTPAPVDKTKIKIQVENGTGISGEAAYLQGVLRSLGYTNVKVGNATSQDNTTTVVSFSSSLSNDVVSEITGKLQNIYQDVTTKTSTTTTFDVIIITGLRKGQTPKPSATPKPSVSPTPTSSGSATPTPTPTI